MDRCSAALPHSRPRARRLLALGVALADRPHDQPKTLGGGEPPPNRPSVDSRRRCHRLSARTSGFSRTTSRCAAFACGRRTATTATASSIFSSFMLERLRSDLQRAKDEHKKLIALSRGNLASQCRVHKAALTMLKATSFEHLLQIVTTDLAVLIDVDVVTLCIESTVARTTRLPLPGIHLLRAGVVDQVLGPDRDVRWTLMSRAIRRCSAAAAGLVRSQALVRLTFGRSGQTGLICVGTRKPGTFHPGLGTELLSFLRASRRDHDRTVARTRPVTRRSRRALRKSKRQERRSAGDVPRFPIVPDPVPLPRFSAADDLRAAIGLWAAWLSGERRASPHTVAAYGRDLAGFPRFPDRASGRSSRPRRDRSAAAG